MFPIVLYWGVRWDLLALVEESARIEAFRSDQWFGSALGQSFILP